MPLALAGNVIELHSPRLPKLDESEAIAAEACEFLIRWVKIPEVALFPGVNYWIQLPSSILGGQVKGLELDCVTCGVTKEKVRYVKKASMTRPGGIAKRGVWQQGFSRWDPRGPRSKTTFAGPLTTAGTPWQVIPQPALPKMNKNLKGRKTICMTGAAITLACCIWQ